MAQIIPKHMYIILNLFAFSFLLFIEGESHKFSKSLQPQSLGLKKEKLTHLHFYFRDIFTSDHPTVVKIAEAATTNTSKTIFGATFIFDDALTVGPEETSKLVGRAQGMYAFVDQREFALLMVLNFVFSEGKFKGSTLSVSTRNPVTLTTPREITIVGGSGRFRFARGYALANTYSANFTNGNAVVEYDVYVLHY